VGKHFCCALAAAAAALALSSPAAADPWDGGRDMVTPFEAELVAIASEIAERPVQMHCNGADEWSALAEQTGFEAMNVWGYVTFTRTLSGWAPGDEAQLSEAACRYADVFWRDGPASKPARSCRVGTKIRGRVEHRKRRIRVRAGAGFVMRWKRVPVQVRVEVPVVGLCPGYVEERLFALQTIAHEAVHLSGVEDEAVAECYGMQFLAWVAWKLGAPDGLAREMAADYWREYYVVERPGTPYFDEGCRDGGVLDLAPDRTGWPAPDAIRGAAALAGR
jgi:hypothetical protein